MFKNLKLKKNLQLLQNLTVAQQFLLSLIVSSLFPIAESETEFKLHQQKKTVAVVKVKPMIYINAS
jgi:hypothetical protein